MKLFINQDRSFNHSKVVAIAMLFKIFKREMVTITADKIQCQLGYRFYDYTNVFDDEKRRDDQFHYEYLRTYSGKSEINLSSSGLIYKYNKRLLFKSYNFFEYAFEIFKEIYEESFFIIDSIDSGKNIDNLTDEFVMKTLDIVESFNVKGAKNEDFFEWVELVTIELDNYLKNKLFERYPKIKSIKKLIEECEDETLWQISLSALMTY